MLAAVLQGRHDLTPDVNRSQARTRARSPAPILPVETQGGGRRPRTARAARHPRGRNALRLPSTSKRGALTPARRFAGPRNAYASCGVMSEAKHAMSPISAAIPNSSTQPIPGAVSSGT
jgi:hypothetical protein